MADTAREIVKANGYSDGDYELWMHNFVAVFFSALKSRVHVEDVDFVGPDLAVY